MEEKQYVLDLETQKIELRFDKADYMALSDGDKQKLRGAYQFSGKRKAWVSRSTRNHYRARRVAEELGFVDAGRVGERLSFAEQQERKAERALERVERFENYADNAQSRGQGMQAEFKENAKDWSWLTQPNVNTSAGRSFTNRRNKILERYERGFAEYRKSAYFRDRAEIAQATADQTQLKSRRYLNNRIEECNKNIRDLERKFIQAEGQEGKEAWLERLLESMEYEVDKLAYFENCLEEIGGVKWNKDNIKPGYLVKIRGHYEVVLKANPKTVESKSPHVPFSLKYAYAEIQDVQIPEEWSEPTKAAPPVNPFADGDLLTATNVGGDRVINAFQVVKTTAKNVMIQRVQIQDNKPVKDAFISDKQERRSVKMTRDNTWVVNYDSWYLYKFNG